MADASLAADEVAAAVEAAVHGEILDRAADGENAAVVVAAGTGAGAADADAAGAGGYEGHCTSLRLE